MLAKPSLSRLRKGQKGIFLIHVFLAYHERVFVLDWKSTGKGYCLGMDGEVLRHNHDTILLFSNFMESKKDLTVLVWCWPGVFLFFEEQLHENGSRIFNKASSTKNEMLYLDTFLHYILIASHTEPLYAISIAFAYWCQLVRHQSYCEQPHLQQIMSNGHF